MLAHGACEARRAFISTSVVPLRKLVEMKLSKESVQVPNIPLKAHPAGSRGRTAQLHSDVSAMIVDSFKMDTPDALRQPLGLPLYRLQAGPFAHLALLPRQHPQTEGLVRDH